MILPSTNGKRWNGSFIRLPLMLGKVNNGRLLLRRSGAAPSHLPSPLSATWSEELRSVFPADRSWCCEWVLHRKSTNSTAISQLEKRFAASRSMLQTMGMANLRAPLLLGSNLVYGLYQLEA